LYVAVAGHECPDYHLAKVFNLKTLELVYLWIVIDSQLAEQPPTFRATFPALSAGFPTLARAFSYELNVPSSKSFAKI
jgi:hypothetical protein